MDWIWTGKYNVGWTLLELLHLKLGGIWYMCGLLFLKKKHGTNAGPHNMRGLIPTNAKKKTYSIFMSIIEILDRHI